MSTPVIYQLPTPLVGSVGVLPVQKYMVSGDNLATITTAGYLNAVNLEGYPIASTDIINVLYSFNPQTQVGTFEQFSVTISGGVITLVALSNAGEVTLPTIANHIATYTNTSGHLSEDPATAISGGNIQAGLSGTAGTVASFPSTASKGSLVLAAVANTGNTNTTISNVAMGQASVISIVDPGNAAARFLVGATATPFVSGNFPVASGTGGLMIDSGMAATAIQNKSNIKAQQVTGLGGSGAGPLTVTAAGATSASVICVSIISSSNPVSVVSVAPGSGNFALTLSGDPGAALSISYIMFIAAQ